MENRKYFLYIIIFALLIKFLLFSFTSICAPRGKFENDSYDYLNTGIMLASHGVFAMQDDKGILKYELNRTPGYPLFLGIFHEIMKIPLTGVIFLQVLLTIVTAFVTYRIAREVDNGIAFLSAVIVLFDFPVTIFSLMLMTESLYLFLLSLFMLAFVRYLKDRGAKLLIVSAMLLAMATYVRPISYYLGGATAVFIAFANIRGNLKKAIVHIFLFCVVVYGIMGIWQLRNYIHFSYNTFSSIVQTNIKVFGIFHSYAANKDPFTQGMAPIPYYLDVTWRCILSLMTRPGSFKYFHSHLLTIMGKVFGYPWVAFWMTGFLIGLSKIKQNIEYQFILFIILYFLITTICGDMWCSAERFRVPIVPCIAIVSASGWKVIWSGMKGRRTRFKKFA